MTILLYSLGQAISINSIVIFDVSFDVSSGLRAMQPILIGCSQNQKSFFPSFPIIFPRSLFVVYNFVSPASSPFSTAHFNANTFKVLLNRMTYPDPSSFLHPERKWCTVSLCSPHNLHLSHSTDALIFLHGLVSIICSRNENIYGVFVGCISTSLSLLLCQ